MVQESIIMSKGVGRLMDIYSLGSSEIILLWLLPVDLYFISWKFVSFFALS
jgi:hypothetical protein